MQSGGVIEDAGVNATDWENVASRFGNLGKCWQHIVKLF